MKQGIVSTGRRGPSLLRELDRRVQCPSDLRTELIRRREELQVLNKRGELRVSDEMLREYEELAQELRSKGKVFLPFDKVDFLNTMVKSLPIAAEVQEFWKIRSFHEYPPPLEAFARYWKCRLGSRGFGCRDYSDEPDMREEFQWERFWQKRRVDLWNLDALADDGKVVTLEAMIAADQQSPAVGG